jgi:PilZ domain
LSALSNWFHKPSFSYRERAERRSAPYLAAYYWDGSTPKQNNICNISQTGAYLLTQQRWAKDEVISLTLQRKGPLARTPEHRFSLQAKTVRRDKNGVGVSFVMPLGADLRLWQSPLKTVEEQTEPEDILREFRTAAAVAFLRRICPVATKEVRLLLRERLSNYRLESAVEIALHAEEILVFEPGTRKMRAHPRLVLRILEDGSWAESERVLHFWAGLLATSCSISAEDQSNMVFIDLLSDLTPSHVRIFTAACAKVITFESERGVSAQSLICPLDEMTQIAGSSDLIKIDRDLEHLSELGLLVKRDRSRSFSLMDDANLTPTRLGLDLYARCNAHRGAAQDYYGASRADIPEPVAAG